MGYIKDVIKTESNDFKAIKDRIDNNDKLRLLHGVMGVSTEAGELLDQLKKNLFYGKNLDLVNIEEEVGDLFWYCGIICDVLGKDFEGIQKKNIEKLRARYGDKFSENKAINRDLKQERDILEN